jgi:zinc transport system ATP-binding protein
VKKIRDILNDVLYVSRLTKIKRKKIRILFSAVISNAISFADILIILSFSRLLTGTVVVDNYYLDKVLEFSYSIPIIVVIRYIINFIGKYNIYSLTKDIERSLKTYLLEEVYKKGNYSLADATYYIENLSTHISYFFNAFSNIASSLIQIVVFTVYLSYDNYQILLLLFSSIIILYYPTKFLLIQGRKAMDDSFNFSKFAARNIQRIIDNLYLVKILNTQKVELLSFDKNLAKLYNSEKKKFIFSDINATVPNFVAVFAFSILAVLPTIATALTLEFIGITLRLVQTLGAINASLSMLVGSHVHLGKLFLVESNKEDTSNFSSAVSENNQSAIIVEDLNFRFFNSSEMFFENINLNIEKHKHYIVTGVNGSGKSTLLGILAGALNPLSGSIIKNSNNIGYIGASPLILEDTLKSNLTYGKNVELTDKVLIELIKEFNVFSEFDDDILLKQISNKTLSSGQMQKISFIRAFSSGCDILFLDESTANLDTSTKLQISKILDSKNITIINSTHNPEDFNYDHHYAIKVNESDVRSISQIN